MLTNNDINIRDPYVLTYNGEYYLYGTRANDFGIGTSGFDVYKSTDLVNWSEPISVFDSSAFNMNKGSNWAPEIHEFNGKFYIFATFEQPNGFRGTYSLVSDTPDGKFVPCSTKALTPENWWSLDGTLYVSAEGIPYLVFCHEHVQILNGTICYIRLSNDLKEAIGEPVYLFSGLDAYGAKSNTEGRYVTDGPFIYRGINNRLYMIWSTTVNNQYHQCIAVSDNDDITGKWTQLQPIFTRDGGHGMIFRDLEGNLKLTLHCPNRQPDERPVFFDLTDTGVTLKIK